MVKIVVKCQREAEKEERSLPSGNLSVALGTGRGMDKSSNSWHPAGNSPSELVPDQLHWKTFLQHVSQQDSHLGPQRNVVCCSIKLEKPITQGNG